MKNLLLICLTFFVFSSLKAQRVIQPKLIEVDWKGIIYKKEWSVDFRMHENGFAVAYNSGKIVSYQRTNYYQLELGFIKDPREKNQSRVSAVGGSGTFSYGKINSMFNLRAGVGVKRYLSEKEKRKGVAVGYTYMIGPSLALMKPYYLDFVRRQEINGEQRAVIVSERYDGTNEAEFLDISGISGRSSFFKGFDELSVRAGIQGKIGAHIAMGAFDKTVRAFETGFMFDIFPAKIPIFIETDGVRNRHYFLHVYFNLHLGSRKN